MLCNSNKHLVFTTLSSSFVHWHHSLHFMSRVCGPVFGSHFVGHELVCVCVSRLHLDCFALKHLLPSTWLRVSSLGLWFHFSLFETRGCGFGWLFRTLPFSINLTLERKACSLTSYASLRIRLPLPYAGDISLLDMSIKKAMWPAELLKLGDGGVFIRPVQSLIRSSPAGRRWCVIITGLLTEEA